MSQARLFLACLACALTAMDAAAGTAKLPRNPIAIASPPREEDPEWQWFNAMRSVKIRLAWMSVGSDGVVAYEMSEVLSENPLAMSDFRASLEGKATGFGVAIPATLVTDSLATALSGDGRGEGRKRPRNSSGIPQESMTGSQRPGGLGDEVLGRGLRSEQGPSVKALPPSYRYLSAACRLAGLITTRPSLRAK